MSETKMINVGVALVSIFVVYFTGSSCVFTTPQRHVTLLTNWGELQNTTYLPGWNFKNPFSNVHHVKTDEQVDYVLDVPCHTSDGIELWIPRIEVHNRLPYDKARSVFLRAGENYDQLWIFKLVHFFVAQKCNELTAEEAYLTKFNDFDEYLTYELSKYQIDKETGLVILKTKFQKMVAKNSNILDEFKKRAEAKAERKALLAQVDTIEQKNINELNVAKGKNDLEAAKAAAGQRVETLALEADLERKQKAAEAARIEGHTINLRELELTKNKAIIKVANAKAELEATKHKALGNIELFTPEYLAYIRAKELGKMNKVYYGPDVDKVFLHHKLP